MAAIGQDDDEAAVISLDDFGDADAIGTLRAARARRALLARLAGAAAGDDHLPILRNCPGRVFQRQPGAAVMGDDIIAVIALRGIIGPAMDPGLAGRAFFALPALGADRPGIALFTLQAFPPVAPGIALRALGADRSLRPRRALRAAIAGGAG